MIKIAIDAMGGDSGPAPIIDGLTLALKQDKTFTAIAVGKKNEILHIYHFYCIKCIIRKLCCFFNINNFLI